MKHLEFARVAELLRAVLEGISPTRKIRRKLRVIEAATKHAYPVTDIHEMLAEIEHGRR